jgi:transcriptional regulator with XRE-family HTH domain
MTTDDPDELAVAEFLDALSRRRLRLGMSLRAVAKAAGIDPSLLSRMEAGKRGNPSAVSLARLARALGLPIDWPRPDEER